MLHASTPIGPRQLTTIWPAFLRASTVCLKPLITGGWGVTCAYQHGHHADHAEMRTHKLVSPSNGKAQLLVGKDLGRLFPRKRQDMGVDLPWFSGQMSLAHQSHILGTVRQQANGGR